MRSCNSTNYFYRLNNVMKIIKIYINLKEWFEYVEAERDFTIKKLKSEDPSKYSLSHLNIVGWNEKLRELALKRANARRRQTQSQGAVAQGGTRRKMRARTYKKYSYKSYKR